MRKILLTAALVAPVLLQQAAAQNRQISGRVTDRSTGQGLPGVTVLVKGTTIGVSTNSDGSYTISAPSSATALSFSSIGFIAIERNIGDASSIDIGLATDSKQLNEVVVTALGIEKDKRSLGYSTQTIESAQLTQGRDRSVLNSLQGKVAGVQINNASGGVGSSTRVVIRGNKSLTGNNQPLYVVDGIPIDNQSIGTGDNLNNGVDTGNRANDINPEDVESVNILKGPAATALYGSRAANGAIIITTKSGRGAAKRGKKAEVAFTSSYVIDDILFLPEFQNEYGQGYELQHADTRENFSWGPKFDGVDRTWGQIVNNQQRSKPYVGLKNNVKEFFDLGKTFTNTLSLSGGDEKSNYIFSASNVNQKGVTPNTEYNRTSVKVGGETKLANKITSSASVTYTRSGGDLSVTGQGNNSIYNQIIQTPRDISLLELKDLNNPFNNINGYYGAYTVNPWQIIKDNTFRNDVDRILGNTQLGYTFNDHFKLTGRVGLDVYNDRRKQFVARRFPTASGQNGRNSDDGFYGEDQITNSELTTDVIATYNGNITPDLTISALVGHNFNQRRFDQTSFAANILVSNSFGQNFANNAENGFANNGSTRSLRRLMGVYSTVDLGFRDYLFLGLTARNDWSSTLPKENRSFFYPAVNLGFVFTELLGMQDNKYFSYGKLRANYAQVGNDAPVYQTQSTFGIPNITGGFAGTDLQFPLNGVVAYGVGNRIGSNTLQPEISKALEFGGEFRFLGDRLTTDISVYDTRSTKQIINVPLSSSTGFTSLTSNVGEIQNRGIEILVSGTPIKVGDFTWDLSVNYTKNKNEVLSLLSGIEEVNIGGTGATALVARVGEPYGVFRSTDVLRNDAGQVVVNPTTGIPLASPVQNMGTVTPDFNAGLNSTFSYKGISLSVVVDTKQGGKIFSRTRDLQRFVGTAPETLYNNRQPFVVPNSVIQNENGSYSPNTQPVKVVDYWGQLPDGTNIVDASYTKLREIALSYSLPGKFLSSTPFGSLSVGLTGRNLYLWRAKENTYVDPETSNFGNGNNQGFDFSGSPSLRSYGANIRVTF